MLFIFIQWHFPFYMEHGLTCEQLHSLATQKCLNFSWHKFNKGLETFLADCIQMFSTVNHFAYIYFSLIRLVINKQSVKDPMFILTNRYFDIWLGMIHNRWTVTFLLQVNQLWLYAHSVGEKMVFMLHNVHTHINKAGHLVSIWCQDQEIKNIRTK